MAECRCGFNDTPGVKGSDLLIAFGPTLHVDIGFDKDHNPNARPIKKPVAGLTNINALVDTGASESCIDNQIALKLNLPIIDKKDISGAGGRHTVNVYLAQVCVPSLGHVIYGAFAGVDLIAGGQRHGALIGRTFLKDFRMVYEGDTGTVTLTSI